MLTDNKKDMIKNYYYHIIGFFTLLFAPIMLTLVFNDMYNIAFFVLGLFTIICVPGTVRGHPIVRAMKR